MAQLKNVADFGIIGDGKTVLTERINNAITQLSSTGGGELYFPAGVYLAGTVVLKSNVVLNLGAGARLCSTGKREDYLSDEETKVSVFEGEENMSGTLIWGENLKNVGIIGEGVIDGNGIKITAGDKAHLYPEGENHYAHDNYEFYNVWRPFTLKLFNCEHVTLKGVQFTNPASWNVGMSLCKDVFCEGLDIKSFNFYNGDGLDFCSCERVFVSNCSFNCTDDCIALQSAFPDNPCKNVTISNCYFTTLFAGIRIGMACLGDFENVTVTGCVFENCNCSGLKVQQCEGGKIENLVFSGLIMKNVARPFFFTHNAYECTAKRLRKNDWVFGKRGKLGNVNISDIVIENDKEFENGGIVFDGADNFPIENVTLDNVTYRYIGSSGGSLDIQSMAGNRPESHVYCGAVWGGVFLRNCNGFIVKNLNLCDNAKKSERVALLKNCNNVSIEKPVVSAANKNITAIDCTATFLEKSALSNDVVIK